MLWLHFFISKEKSLKKYGNCSFATLDLISPLNPFLSNLYLYLIEVSESAFSIFFYDRNLVGYFSKNFSQCSLLPIVSYVYEFFISDRSPFSSFSQYYEEKWNIFCLHFSLSRAASLWLIISFRRAWSIVNILFAYCAALERHKNKIINLNKSGTFWINNYQAKQILTRLICDKHKSSFQPPIVVLIFCRPDHHSSLFALKWLQSKKAKRQ